MNEQQAFVQLDNDLRIGRQRKAAYYLEKFDRTLPFPEEFAKEIREDFEQMLEELRWAWTCFRDDALARDICWKYAAAAETFYSALSDNFDVVPVSKALLIEMCERGIEAAEYLDSELKMNVQTALAGRAGQLNLELGRTVRAGEFFDFAVQAATPSRNRRLLVRLWSGAGEVRSLEGRYSYARACFVEAVRLATASGDSLGEAYATFGLAKTCRMLRDGLQAAEYFQSALSRSRDLKRQDLEAAILHELGDLCLGIRQFDAAIRCYEDSISIHEALGNILGLCSVRTALGNARLQSGDLDGASVQFEIARRDATEISDLVSLGRVECGIGVIARMQGDNEEARNRFEAALRLAEQCSDDEGRRLASQHLMSLAAGD